MLTLNYKLAVSYESIKCVMKYYRIWFKLNRDVTWLGSFDKHSHHNKRICLIPCISRLKLVEFLLRACFICFFLRPAVPLSGGRGGIHWFRSGLWFRNLLFLLLLGLFWFCLSTYFGGSWGLGGHGRWGPCWLGWPWG